MALLHAYRSDAKHGGKLKLVASRSTGHQEIKLFFQNTLMHLQRRATCMQHWTASAFSSRRNQTLSSIPSLLHPLARHVINITKCRRTVAANARAHLHHRGDRWIARVCWDHADIRLQITTATLLWSIDAKGEPTCAGDCRKDGVANIFLELAVPKIAPTWSCNCASEHAAKGCDFTNTSHNSTNTPAAH